MVAPAAKREAVTHLQTTLEMRDECLNAHWFLSLVEARAWIEASLSFYNESLPHTSPD
jgi:hypothetical protein